MNTVLLLALACTTTPEGDKPGCGPGGCEGEPGAPVCVPFPEVQNEVELVPAFPDMPDFEQPIMLTRAGEDWYLVQRTGQLYRFQDDSSEPELLLDLSDRVDAEGDAGLSAITLDPDFADNGVFYLFYATSDAPVLGDGSGAWRARLSRFTMDALDEYVILEVEQPEDSHIHANDDAIFGPDGYLYLGLGDGGPQNDGDGDGQDLGVLQGKILRIDVGRADEGLRYAIPEDNPFLDTEGARPEIWAYGFRNPWRMSFAPDGGLWVGDVGQDSYEEINLVEGGDNLGWSVKEGPECFEADSCDDTDMVEPVVAHQHYAARSITGGRVYTGSEVETLAGEYVYGDYKYGQVWAFGADRVARVVNGDGVGMASFAEDENGELLMVDVVGGTIYRLVQGASGRGEDGMPTLLSETGCVDPDAPTQKIDAFYAYTINLPFWSDGAEKARWLAMPEGGEMEIEEDGDLKLPPGAVLLKEFHLGDALVETRILAYRGNDLWTALSYRWNDEGTDAELIPFTEAPVVESWPAGDWTHPSRGMCRDCHARQAGGSLGLELAQLARAPIDARLGDEQLAGFVAAGWLDEAPAVEPFPALDDESATLEERARAYLHVNCGYCHRPHGRGRGDIDLQFGTALADTAMCNTRPDIDDLGIDGARIIKPGHPEQSVLLQRVARVGEDAMPPIAKSVVDEDAVALLTAWITAMPEGGDCTIPGE